MTSKIDIVQNNVTELTNLLSVHNPISFLANVTYVGQAPEHITVFLSDENNNELGTFSAIPYKDINANTRQFIFIADKIVRSYLNEFYDYRSELNVLEFVPNITKVMNIWFIDDYTGTYDFCKFVACHASRQFGENQNMIDIEKNQDKHTYIATVGEVVYCYYYSAREGDGISVDTNYEYLLDFDDTPFIDNELFLTSL